MFNYVLEIHNLKLDKDGQPRTTYSLRHYALQTRLNKSGGKVNIYDLARNAGTSVNQLERFYLKRMKAVKNKEKISIDLTQQNRLKAIDRGWVVSHPFSAACIF